MRKQKLGDDVLMKFLHHPSLAPSKHRPGALYDANVLGLEYISSSASTLLKCDYEIGLKP